MSNILIPSYAGGFARNKAEARYPELWRGLQAAWLPFLGPTGPKLFDQSGNHNHGAPPDAASTPSWVTSRMGYALDFDGSNDCIDTDSAIITSGSVTFVAWIKPNANGGATYGTPFVSQGGPVAGSYIRLGILSGGKLGWLVDGGAEDSYTDNAVTLGKWYHYVGIYDSSASPKVTSYLNGDLQVATSSPTAVYAGDRVRVGGTPTGSASYMFNGIIGPVAIYNRALLPQEIASLYANPYALAEESEEWGVRKNLSAHFYHHYKQLAVA